MNVQNEQNMKRVIKKKLRSIREKLGAKQK